MATVVENAFFGVTAPPEATYDFMIDPERVAPRLPGAEILERKTTAASRRGCAEAWADAPAL